MLPQRGVVELTAFIVLVLVSLSYQQDPAASTGNVAYYEYPVMNTAGGEDGGTPCHFPFAWDNVVYFNCTQVDNGDDRFWCGTTFDVDVDDMWAYCFMDCRVSSDGYFTYLGSQNWVQDGSTCSAWEDESWLGIGDFPDDSWDTAGGRCRNPDQDYKLWCYTIGGGWGYCDVDECDDMDIGGDCYGRLLTGDDAIGTGFLTASTCEDQIDSEVCDVEKVRLGSTSSDNADGDLIMGAWCAHENDTDPWILLSLDEEHKFVGIVTQGREDAEDWVLSYKITYSYDGVNYDIYKNVTEGQPQVFESLDDSELKEAYRFEPPFFAKYIKVHPLEWDYYPCMRFDFEACQDEDGCRVNPCANDGTCTDTTDGYLCECAEGYQGDTCSEIFDNCESTPCENGGVCTNAFMAYSCECLTGFSGDSCQEGSHKSCETLALAGADVSAYYSLHFGFEASTESICSMSFPSDGQWDKGNYDGEMVGVGLTKDVCGELCVNSTTCKSVNFFVADGECYLREFYSKLLVKINTANGKTGFKTCTGPKKVYCDFTNTTFPVTILHHSFPINETSHNGLAYLSAYKDKLISYLPVTDEEMNAIKIDSYQCSQRIDYYCKYNILGYTKVKFWNRPDLGGGTGWHPMEYSVSSNDECQCSMGDVCDVIPGSQCSCHEYYQYDFNVRDGDVYTDKQQIPIRGFQFSTTYTWRTAMINLGPLKCTQATIEINECDSNPCQNGAECWESRYFYNCTCVMGWEGDNCEINIDECESNPCQNGATCNDILNGYTCTCDGGYEGDHCEIDIDECESSPCENGASCVDMPERWRCVCLAGFLGVACDIDKNECDYPAPPNGECENGATCSEISPSGFDCACLDGYEGALCEIDTNECAPAPCLNGATCSQYIGSYSCACAPGFTGTNCETEIDECESWPCQNDATCVDVVDGYECICQPGFVGVFCETNVDECASSPCDHGTCVDAPNGFSCTCDPGYTAVLCEEEIDECQSNPCGEYGQCDDVVDGYVCNCDQGFMGDHCETDVNECESFPCLSGGTCFNNISRFDCVCMPGYAGDKCEHMTIDGQWGGWGAWSDCTVQCGSGVETRLRECNNPRAQHGGSACPGGQSEVGLCTRLQCEHVNGGYSVWGSWGRCSVTCGPGTMMRTRDCDNPKPRGDGTECQGTAESTAPCQEWKCGQALDGRWSSWGAWSECSSSCGVGTKLRSRSCSDPPAVYGGDPCVGEDLGASSCMVAECPEYKDCLEWGDWSECSRTCGDGTHQRHRVCRLGETLRSAIDAARTRAQRGTPEIDDEALPAWYWNITLSEPQFALQSCEDKPCQDYQCYTCASEVSDSAGSLTCKGPKKRCDSDYPYCVYTFDPAIGKMTKGCAAHGDCTNSSIECEDIKIQTLQTIMSSAISDVDALQPHPDTLLQAWHSLTTRCSICCAHSLCNRNNLPPGDTIYNTATVLYPKYVMFIVTILIFLRF